MGISAPTHARTALRGRMRRRLAAGLTTTLGLALAASGLTVAPAQAGLLDDLLGDTPLSPVTTPIVDLLDPFTEVLEPVTDPILDPVTGVITDGPGGDLVATLDPVTGLLTGPTGDILGILDPVTEQILQAPVPQIAPGGAGSIEFLGATVCSSTGAGAVCDALPLDQLGPLAGVASLVLTAVPAPGSGSIPEWDPATCPDAIGALCTLPLDDLLGDTPLAPIVGFLPGMGGGADAPDTTITSAAPGPRATSHTFRFAAEPAGDDISFECALKVTFRGTAPQGADQGHDWQACGTSGSASYPGVGKKLANGDYVFAVRAVKGSGDAAAVDETPATQSFRISVPPQVPDTVITAGPRSGAWALGPQVTYRFRSTVEGSQFDCTFNGRMQGTACDNGAFTVRRPGKGTHTFQVEATANGTRDLSAARRVFHVPFDDKQLLRVKKWAQKAQKGHFRNTFSLTRVKGAALVTQAPQRFRRIVLVADKGRGHGTVKVFWNKKLLKTVNLSAKRLQKRKVITIKKFDGPMRRGKIRVVVATQGKPVRIDGLGVADR